jgi:hypothetical protein
VQLALDHAKSHAGMRLSGLDELGDPLLCAKMRICQHGVFFLVCPDEVANIFRCDWQDNVGSGDADSQGHGASEKNVAVARDNGAGHGCDEDVQRTGEDPLARFPWWCQRADGACEAVLKTEGPCQGVIDGFLAANRLVVQGHARIADLDGKSVGGSRTVRFGRSLGGLRSRGQGRRRCVHGHLVVDGLAVLSHAVSLPFYKSPRTLQCASSPLPQNLDIPECHLVALQHRLPVE